MYSVYAKANGNDVSCTGPKSEVVAFINTMNATFTEFSDVRVFLTETGEVTGFAAYERDTAGKLVRKTNASPFAK